MKYNPFNQYQLKIFQAVLGNRKKKIDEALNKATKWKVEIGLFLLV